MTKNKYEWVAIRLQEIADDINDEHGGYFSIMTSIQDILDKLKFERRWSDFLDEYE